MAKHILEIEYDYDFVLIGVSSHDKDYRLCWRLNKDLNLKLAIQPSFEIKNKKQKTPSFFSFYLYENKELFTEYAVIANMSETKQAENSANNLFGEINSDSDILIPEQKQFNYFVIIRGEMENEEVDEFIRNLKEIENIQTAVRIDVKSLRSKQNLIF